VDAEFVAAIAVVLLAGTIAGLAGFGFPLVSVPPLLLIYDPPTVVTLSIALTLATGWVVLLDTWREVHARTVLALVPWALVGVFAGAAMLRLLDAAYIKLLASAVVIAFTLVMIRGSILPGAHSPVATALAGTASGALNASTGIAGPPVVLLFTARDFGIQSFRGSTVAYFVFVDVAGLTVLLSQGIVGADELSTAAALLPAALLGTCAGRSLVRRVSVAAFRRITFGLVLLTGAVGAVNALVDLAG
jgi:uncharacterized membrane protein YfcA